MEVGLKIFPNNIPHIKMFCRLFDFIEIMVTPGFELGSLKKPDKPLTLHCPHQSFGFNVSNPSIRELNERVIAKTLKAADMFDAEFVVVHTGHIEPGTGMKRDEAWKNMAGFFREHNDTRIVFENLIPCELEPQYGDSKERICTTPADIKRLMGETGLGFTLDFNHAIATANILGIEPLGFVSQFMALSPSYFHLAGQDIDSKHDGHKHLFQSKNNDYSFLKKVGKGKMLALETSTECMERPETHLRNLEVIRNALKSR